MFSALGQQAVRIGNHVLSTVDVNITHFNNGDEIPIFASMEEAKTHSVKGKPACVKVGSSLWYNWYAVNDKRGVSLRGWHVPSYSELDDLQFACRENFQSVIDHKNRNYLPGTPSGMNQQEPFFKWWVSGENKEFADSYVQILQCVSSLGPFNFVIVKKSDFFPIRLFADDPQNIEASLYFTKQKKFQLSNVSNEWEIAIFSENCDWDQLENQCYGKATISLISKIDSLKTYKVNVADLIFSIDKNDQIISDLGLVFEDFNGDGLSDFGFGFDGNKFDGLLPEVFLQSKDGKRLEYNKEFNHLFSTMEHFSYDLSNSTFECLNTNPDGFDAIKYYLCPRDSLKIFNNYVLPNELTDYEINYPNLFIISYFSKSGNAIKSFDYANGQGFTERILNEIELGEFDESSSYYFAFEKSNIYNLVEKIDSITFYNSYSKVKPSPFLLKEQISITEKTYLKNNKTHVSRKNNSLKIECSNGKNMVFENNEENGESYLFYGLTEDNNCFIVRSYGEYDSHGQLLINKETCQIDSLDGYPRFSPNGDYIAIGEYIEEEGAFGYLSLYKKANSEYIEIGSIILYDLEYSFAPYDLFWIDDKTIFVKKLKTNGDDENNYYFDYAKITIDYYNELK
jgi:hypothetical protein